MLKSLMEFVGLLVVVFLLVVLITAILALPLMILWNWLMPMIFGLTKLTWLESWGLMFLCSFLFKSSDLSSYRGSKKGKWE